MKFALLYSIGNILSLGSTGFLTGFARQAKNMFKATRLVATVMYLGCLIMTIVSACVLKSFPLDDDVFGFTIFGVGVVLFELYSGW